MPPGTQLGVDARSLDGCDLLVLRGELDLTTVGVLDDAIAATTQLRVVLDVGAVHFLDSAGMRAIDRANRSLGREGRRLALVAPPLSAAAATFRIAGFAGDFLLDSLEDALSDGVARDDAESEPG